MGQGKAEEGGVSLDQKIRHAISRIYAAGKFVPSEDVKGFVERVEARDFGDLIAGLDSNGNTFECYTTEFLIGENTIGYSQVDKLLVEQRGPEAREAQDRKRLDQLLTQRAATKDVAPHMNTARVIQVIETTLSRRGFGRDASDPIRYVRQYWSLDGKLLAEVE